MTQFFNSLKGLITPEMISKASAEVEEKESNVSCAVSSIMANLLGVLLKKGHSLQIRNILEEAGNLKISSDIKGIFEEKPTQDQQKIGDDFLEHLVGNKAIDLTDPIATHANISKVACNRLISMIAPVVAGFLGEKQVKDNLTSQQLLDEIKKGKGSFESLVLPDVIKSFNLSSIFQSDKTAACEAQTEDKQTKKSNSWILWLVLLVLLMVIFFWWRSCQESKNEVYYKETITVIKPAPGEASNRVVKELFLPDGTKLQAYSGGVEDRMIHFLQSNEYKNATNDDLKSIWFEFDNIAFTFDSSTELKPESKVQIANIIAIMKYFKDAKIKIGTFADKVGSENVNLKISQERAKTIESLFEEGGIGSQIVKVQGYGESYAIHSEKDSNEARAEDRDIVLFFVK